MTREKKQSCLSTIHFTAESLVTGFVFLLKSRDVGSSGTRHGSVVERWSPELHTDMVRVRASSRTEDISVWMMP